MEQESKHRSRISWALALGLLLAIGRFTLGPMGMTLLRNLYLRIGEALHWPVPQDGFASCVPVLAGEVPDIFFAFLLGFLTLFLLQKFSQVYNRILIAMLSGALFGYIFGPVVSSFVAPFGTLFIRLLKMIIVPLVFASLTLGVVSLGDIRKIGRIGGKTVLYFLITTAFSILIGLGLANFVKPGKYVSEEDRQRFEKQYESKIKNIQHSAEQSPFSLSEMMVNSVPTNPIESMAKGNMLQIIFFALLFGLVLTTISVDKKEVIQKGLEGINEAMIKIVMWVMAIAPLGVFALMADSVANTGLSVLRALLVYALVVLVGFVLQVVLVYGPILRLVAQIGLLSFLKKVWPVLLMAFSTSSSSATLPVTMRCTEEDLGVSKDLSSFVLSLGATVNMNGTALYLSVAAIFVAQVCNIELSWTQQTVILLITTLSAVGTPGIPSGSIVFLTIVLESVHVPAMGIALVMGVDRILDMSRTVLNVMGDMTATLVVNATEKDGEKGLSA